MPELWVSCFWGQTSAVKMNTERRKCQIFALFIEQGLPPIQTLINTDEERRTATNDSKIAFSEQ